MEGFHKGIVIALLVIVGFIMWPTLHWAVGNINTSGFIPLFKLTTNILPYAFLGIVAYVVLKIK